MTKQEYANEQNESVPQTMPTQNTKAGHAPRSISQTTASAGRRSDWQHSQQTAQRIVAMTGGAMSRSTIHSAVVIARLLSSEGFSDHVGNMVEKYWLRNVCREGGRKRQRKLDDAIAAMCAKLTDSEKLVLGKFIAMHKRMSFDTGLHIGLTAFAQKNDKSYELATGEGPIPSAASPQSENVDEKFTP